MKLAFVINDLKTERSGYTTTHLALAAHRMGHEVWYIEVGRFAFAPDGCVHADARRLPTHDLTSVNDVLASLRVAGAPHEDLTVDAIDALFLRNDPSDDALKRPWAQLAGVNFGRLAQQAGVVVVNNPEGLYHAVNKLYLQLFPKAIRPRSLISRNPQTVRDFINEVGGNAVIKPLRGSGGHNVFLIRREDPYNFNQMFDAVRREGYVIAQEFLPEAAEGDTRLFLLEGELLQVDGQVAAVHRIPAKGDLRSNITAGGHGVRPEITRTIRAIADAARPQLNADGMFLVGLDLIGDKMVEVNVFSPGALATAGRLANVDFATPVIEALERRVQRQRTGG
jgi:glutathione synthase